MKKPLPKLWAVLAFVICSLSLAAQPAGWSYLLPITVTENSAQTITNYQMRVVFDSQTLIAANQMQANGADIRFGKNCNGTVLYNFWVEANTLNTPTTVAWVKIDTLFASQSRTIYMYYGNNSAISASAVAGTFIGPHSSTDSVASGNAGGATNSQRGFRFTPNEDLLVTHFGKREPNGTTRYITLFNFTTQAILEQTQVAGPAAQYSYGALANPRWLTSGTQYLLQLYQGAADGYYFGTSSQIGQHITYGDMRYCNSCTQNTFPTNTLSNYHYGYPDMWYWTKQNVSPAPTFTLGNPGQAFLFEAGGNISGSCLIPFYTIGDTASGGGPFTYSWSPGATLNSTTVGQVQASPSVTTTYTCVVTNASGCIVTDSVQIIIPPSPVLTTSVSASTICFGDSVTLSATGADAYDWQPGAYAGNPITIPVAATTTFTLTGTDNSNGCSSTAQVTVNVLPLPAITTSGNTSICAGDSATISASGGNSYAWSSGDTTASAVVSPSATTTYSVLVTDTNGCSVSDSVAVAVNAQPVVSITGSPVVCTGSPFTLTASAGSSYLWSTGATTASITETITANQTYNVSVTDSNGCIGTDTLAVTVNPLPTVLVSGDTSLCQGGSATLIASGASTYVWFPSNQTTASISITPSQTTTYTVTGTDANGCSNSVTILVAVNQLPNVQLISSTNTACLSDGPIVFNTVPASGGTLSGPGVSGNQFTPATAGVGTHTITFSYTDANGCSNSATQQVVVSACVGIQETAGNAMLVYPNPANNQLFVETTSNGMNTIRIYDSRGRLVLTTVSSATRTELNVETLGSGIYLLEVMSEDGKRSTQNVMIQQ